MALTEDQACELQRTCIELEQADHNLRMAPDNAVHVSAEIYLEKIEQHREAMGDSFAERDE